jgi:4-hydroxy-tetrahydrodipicolinate synthase
MTDPCPVAMRGIVPSLNTPFADDDRVDEAALRRLVGATRNAGCAGMLALAFAGEQASLSPAERERAARIIVESAAGLPVIVSVTAGDLATSRALAAMARSAGADAVCWQAPHGANADALIAAAERIAEAGPGMLMIQDLDWSGPGLPIDTIARLFEAVPAFQCIKIETARAGAKYSAVLAATGGRLHVSGGWAAAQMIEALARGVHAFMPTGVEHVYVAIHRLFCAGRPDRARAWFERLLPILAFTQQHIDISIRFWKMFRRRQGLFGTDRCRPPVAPLDAYQEREAQHLLARAIALDEEACRGE